jgi:vacuolar-type H+-ATPase subunit E/Vma4
MVDVYNFENIDNKLLTADDVLAIANNKKFLEDKKKQLKKKIEEYQDKKEKEFIAEIFSIYQQLEKQLDEILLNMESRALSAVAKIVKQLHVESIAPDYILSVIQNELNHYRDADNVVIITCHQSYVDFLEQKLKHDDLTILYNNYEDDNKHVVFIENKYLKTKFDVNIFLNSTEDFIDKMQQNICYYRDNKAVQSQLSEKNIDESATIAHEDELDIIA